MVDYRQFRVHPKQLVFAYYVLCILIIQFTVSVVFINMKCPTVSDFLNLPEILDLPRPRRRNSPLPRVLRRAHKPPGSRSRDVRAPVHGSVVFLEYFLI